MPPERIDLDIAISFLNQDLGLATALRDGLIPLEVFVYASKQEELAGTDGLQSFRDAFRHRARLVVIIHREGWGTTPWTRVEQEAITDRFLKEGPSFLFVIMLDDAAPPPWLPEKLIRFNLKDFGVEQAIGAIKARAVELGGTVQAPSVATLAALAQGKARFAKEREELFRTENGVRQAGSEAARLVDLISSRISEAQAAAAELQIEFGASKEVCVARAQGVSVVCGYQNRVINVLSEARLFIREMKGQVILPGQNAFYLRDPTLLEETKYLPALTPALGWCWKSENDEILSSEQVADSFVRRFFSLLDRRASGELPDRWDD